MSVVFSMIIYQFDTGCVQPGPPSMALVPHGCEPWKFVWFIAPPPPPLLLTSQIWATFECTQISSKYVERPDCNVIVETASVGLISTKSNLLLSLLCLVKVRFCVNSRESLKSELCAGPQAWVWAGLSPAQNKESEHNKASKHLSIGEWLRAQIMMMSWRSHRQFYWRTIFPGPVSVIICD